MRGHRSKARRGTNSAPFGGRLVSKWVGTGQHSIGDDCKSPQVPCRLRLLSEPLARSLPDCRTENNVTPKSVHDRDCHTLGVHSSARIRRARFSLIRLKASIGGKEALGVKGRYLTPNWLKCAPKIRALIG